MPSAFLSFILACNCYGNIASNAPYPPSSVITRFTWDRDVVKLKDGAGDNWPITWVDDDLQITSYGDGNGFSDSYHHKFPTKWMSNDGRTMWLLFSGLDGGYYSFCVRKASLEF
jgi:hypothetical protein